MAAPLNLTPNCIQMMYSGQECPAPTVQVLEVKRIASPAGQPQNGERFRLVLSDGSFFIQSMLTTQLNRVIKANQVQAKSVIRLTEYICNTVHGRRIVIVLNLDVVSGPLNSNIGNPLNVESVGGIHTPFGSAPGAPQHQAAPAHSAHPPAPAAAAAAAPINSPQAAIKTQPRVQVPATAPADIANQHIFPINTINPYLPKWTIRARVTHKSDMKTWNNQKGSGTLFSVDLLDETGEIRATMFQDAAQHFFPILVPGKVYFISKGTLKFANKRYSSLKNEYELTLDLNSYVVPADDDVKVDIPKAHFHFVPIDHINEMNKDDMVDIIGIVQSYKPLSSIKTRAGNDLSKRSIEIIDSSNRSIELTLWGERAENFVEAEDHPVIACKSVKVGDFGGKNLSVLSSSQVEFNPDLPKAHELRAWYDGLDPNSISTMIHSLSNTQISGGSGLGAGRAYPDRTLADVRDQGIGKNATEYFTIRATIMALKSDKTLAYMACANPTCSKKVVQIGNQYQCDKCNKPYPTFKWRYIFQMSVADHTNNQWVNVFNDTGEAVLGVSADDLMGWKENNDPRFEQVMDQARYQSFICKASAAEETYMDERRVRVRLSNAQPITGNALIEDSRWLLTKIKEMQGLA